MTTRIRGAGEFCWINMITPQPEQARAFFGSLLGWTYSEIPGMGHNLKAGGQDFGGLFDLDGPATPKGTPPHIGVMVKVQSADATREKSVALGGKARGAWDIGDRLRMGECSDPNGAPFDVWEPKSHQGTIVDSSLHGAPCWFELLTTDANRAQAFYAALFGWTPKPMPSPGIDYTIFNRGSEGVGGMLPITPEMGNMPSHWAVYFNVANADAAADKAVALGAKIRMTMKDIPGAGRFCGITSPQGVMFYILEPKP